MSPLTPTVLETQAPLITPGSFPGLPKFATKVQEAINLVNPSDMEGVLQKKQEIEQQKSHLTNLLEELKESQKDYDFDYEDRLLLSDSEIENILENEIFRKDGIMTELGKSFYEYLEILTEGKSEELKGKMKRKLMKEFGLEDRVLENSINMSGGAILFRRVDFMGKDKEQFFKEINKICSLGTKGLDIGENYDSSGNVYRTLYAPELMKIIIHAGRSGVKSLNIARNQLSRQFDALHFCLLVKEAGRTGIISLNLWGNGLSYKLEAPDFLELVKEAGLSGIKTLNLGSNGLSEKLEAPDFLELVKQAGLSGIKTLNLGSNGLSKKLEAPDFLELVKQAGESGIRSLNLWGNSLSKKLEAPDLLQFVRQSGSYGIKSLDIGGNEFHEIFEASDFIELVKQAGLSGIKSLDISGNNLHEKLEASDFIELVKQAGLSGIKSLHLDNLSIELNANDFLILVTQAGSSGIKSLNLDDDLSDVLNDYQQEKIDSIAKQYALKFNYCY